MGVASTGGTILGVGWTRWTRIEHVEKWLHQVIIQEGTEGASSAPNCALPPASPGGHPIRVGGRVFKNRVLAYCYPLGETGEGVRLEHRVPYGEYGFEDWYAPGAMGHYFEFSRVRASDGTEWESSFFGVFVAKPCDHGELACKLLRKQEEHETGISHDLAKNPALKCTPEED